MRHVLALFLSLLLSACLAPLRPDEVLVPVQLAGENPPVTRLGEVEVLGAYRLRGVLHGISGLAWDGDDLVAVSDFGDWMRFAVDLDDAGRPMRMTIGQRGRLGGVGKEKRHSDAEEVERDGDGWLVAFERNHRIWRYGADLSGSPALLPTPSAMADLPENEGIEAMTRLADGRLLLVAEGTEDGGRSVAWLGDGDGWQQLSYAHDGLFRPTGATALPDGGVLMVERRFTLMGGFAMRLVRIDSGAIAAGRLSGVELARLEPPMTVDNFEGIAVQRRSDGRLVASVVSDDNMNPLQSTLLLVLLLP